MTEIIAFPNEPYRLQAMGQKKMREHDFIAANKCFIQLYQIQPSFSHCQLLAKSFQAIGAYPTALEICEDYLEEFLNDESAFTEYFHLLLLDGQFLLAHRWLTKVSMNTEQLTYELSQLENTQKWLDDSQEIKLHQLLKWEESGKPIPQKQWQMWVKNLSRDDLYDICSTYFQQAKNPFIPPKLFEELVKSGEKRTIKFVDKEVILSTLPLVEETPVLQEVYMSIKQANLQDPQLEEMVLAEINAHFALMYPFLPNRSEAQDWAKSYLLEYRALLGDSSATNRLVEYRLIQNQKQRLRELYQTLV